MVRGSWCVVRGSWFVVRGAWFVARGSWFVVAAMCLIGCGRPKVERIAWPVMGTVAAVQTRGTSASSSSRAAADLAKKVFADVERKLNAHNPDSELSRLAPLDERDILAKCDKEPTSLPYIEVKPCYEAAFKLMKASGGAFNPRWRGPKTLDLGAIAKGFSVDVAARAVYVDGADALLDLGGNLKAVRGEGGSHKPWKTGVKNPSGDGFAATVELNEGEALATSATYFRGTHIYDGRTGSPVTNGVASVTVLCRSAMWADGLSTTLFVLGPDEGRVFLDKHLAELMGERKVEVLWILSDGRRLTYPSSGRHATASSCRWSPP
ncbi:MAG: FAD:protein FMN transferase [Kiritimatiellae bacterium]|nr:FAD:protein FMN transferase [Kiritimatiellia bacterium]